MVNQKLVDLFHSLELGKLKETTPIPQSGSPRRYFIFETEANKYIAAEGNDPKENECFIYFSDLFSSANLPVPKVFGASTDNTFYIQEYRGHKCLLDVVLDNKSNRGKAIGLYKKVLQDLVKFQIDGGAVVDFQQCFASTSFSQRQIMADLNYFKYYFLKLSGFPFREHKIDLDFYQLSEELEHRQEPYFMFRDFQARNILIDENDQLTYIDFQGGMKGPLQYDLAALLYQARAGLSKNERNTLFSFYLETLQERIPVETKDFTDKFYLIVLIRILQTLGAYGFRGFIERKEHFIQSIRPALLNLRELLPKVEKLCNYPELKHALETLTNSENIEKICNKIH